MLPWWSGVSGFLTLTLTLSPSLTLTVQTLPKQKELEAALELLELQQKLATDLGYDSVEELELAMEEIEEGEGGLEVGSGLGSELGVSQGQGQE